MISHEIYINGKLAGKVFIETDSIGKYTGIEVFIPPALIAAALDTDFKDMDFTH